MDHLVDLMVILVAARLAGEIAGRVGVPGVVAEIATGIVVGGSLLGWVHEGDVVATLGELGVIILLLEVGLEMDIGELRAVGRAATSAAVVGVVVPFASGYAVATALGHGGDAALFLGAALTATSVGITARVFSDLGQLGSREARVVLGAAVVDDVLGLVILTVVTRVVTEGNVDAAGVAAVIGAAAAFLIVGAAAGAPVAARFFSAVARHGRGAGTLIVAGLAFALAFATAAEMARLAPIVGAFLAGLGLSATPAADRFRRELRPVGHVLVPVFFVSIGLAVDVSTFTRPAVIALAAALGAVAVAGKLAVALVVRRGDGDRLTIGLGMIPRGEVGLIFATLGLQSGVLDDSLYAALLLAVLATTLATPPLLRLRILATTPAPERAIEMPAGGWLAIDDGVVELRAVPPAPNALAIALAAALAAAHTDPGPKLLDWLRGRPVSVAVWDVAATRDLLALLRAGSPRSWRLLHASGVLECALPELAAAVRRRADDIVVLDPAGAWQWPVVSRLHDIVERDARATAEFARLEQPELLLLSALAVDAAEGSGTAPALVAASLTGRLGLGLADEATVAAVVADHRELAVAARRPGTVPDRVAPELAAHLGTPERARASYLLALAAAPFEGWARGQLDGIYDEVGARLERVAASTTASSLLDLHRQEALSWSTSRAVAARIAATPRTHLATCSPRTIARHAELIERALKTGHVEVAVAPEPARGRWKLDVAALDRPGLLAGIAAALLASGIDVNEAVLATWPDGGAIESFTVFATGPPDPARLSLAAEAHLRRPIESAALPGASVTFDNEASPWHTVCTVEAPDRRGVLRAAAAALAASGATVHAARVETVEGVAVDRFVVSTSGGQKLSDVQCLAITSALTGTAARRRRFRLSNAAM